MKKMWGTGAYRFFAWVVNHEKAKANQNRKYTWPLHSPNKRQNAEIRVATAPAQSALLAQSQFSFPDSHILYTIV